MGFLNFAFFRRSISGCLPKDTSHSSICRPMNSIDSPLTELYVLFSCSHISFFFQTGWNILILSPKHQRARFRIRFASLCFHHSLKCLLRIGLKIFYVREHRRRGEQKSRHTMSNYLTGRDNCAVESDVRILLFNTSSSFLDFVSTLHTHS